MLDAERFCAATRRRLRVILVSDAVFRAALFAFAGFALCVFLDGTAPLPALVRTLLVAAVVASMVSVLYRRGWRPLQRSMDDRVLAQMGERRFPTLNGLLLSAVDGVPLTDADRRLLAERLPAEAPRVMIRSDGAARRGIAVVLLTAAILAVTVVYPSWMSIAAQRFFLPWGAAEWPRSSELAVRIERSVVAEDEPLVLDIERLRGAANPLQISWRTAQGSVERRVLGALSGPWREAFQLPVGSYDFIVTSGDALPVAVAARIVERPRVSLLSAELQAPVYAQRPAESLSTLSGASVLAGSQLAIRMQVEHSPHRNDAELSVHFAGTALPYERIADELHFTVPVMEAGDLVLEVTDFHGQGSASPVVVESRPRARYPIALTADRPPQVELSGPRQGEAVTPRALITLHLHARDDIGLASLALRSRVLRAGDGESGEETLLHEFRGVEGVQATQRRHQLVLSPLVRVGDSLELVGEASDANDVTGPGVGRSSPRLLRIVSEDSLRSDLDQQLVEVRDRLLQSRESLARGLADPEMLTDSARGANSIARRGAEQMADVSRRWRENQLDEERSQALAQATAILDQRALPGLVGASIEGAPGAEEQARAADQALGEAAAMVSSMLESDDLLRILESLIRRQEALNAESRQLVLRALTAAPDDAARAQATSIVERQREIAGQLRDVERSILGSEVASHDPARAIIEREQPADLLQRAASGLAAARPQQNSVGQQDQALQVMRSLLDALRGSDLAAQLADDIGRLAEEQAALAEQMTAGTNHQELRQRQQELRQRAAELAERVGETSADNREAREAMEQAQQSQDEAGSALEQSNSGRAQREAVVAAAQLRAAQRALAGDDGSGADGDNDDAADQGVNILALLREQIHKQTLVVNRAAILDARFRRRHQGEGGSGAYTDLTFSERRDVQDLAADQDDIQLILVEQGIAELDDQPIARRALQRVIDALQRSHEHLAQPAMGPRGVRLPRIALHEMQVLLAIAENLPPPQDSGESGDGDGDGGSEDQPPFPPAAEIALVKAEQGRLALRTRAQQPGQLAAEQRELVALVEHLLGGARPGSRSRLLLERTQRAMLSAHYLLSDEADRGTLTQTEQDLAATTLGQLLVEAQQAAASSSSSQQQQGSQADRGESEPSDADGEGSGAAASTASAAAAEGAGTGGDTTAIINEAERGAFMHYAPTLRPRLMEALSDESLPADARALLRRYYELLER